MLITSRFHDYYDSVTSFGVDKTVVYSRVSSDIKCKRKDYSIPHEEKLDWDGKGVTYLVLKHVIGFCGKLYPVIEFRLNVIGGFRSQFFYDAESVTAFMKRRGIKQNKNQYYWRDVFYVTSEVGLKNWFDVNRWTDLGPLFQEHKVPAFILSRTGERLLDVTLTLNPRLQSYQFFKVQDTVTAFQNIYMFISGVLGVSTPKMVEIDDKQMAKKKGHDGKYSFRKPPSKRGKKSGNKS